MTQKNKAPTEVPLLVRVPAELYQAMTEERFNSFGGRTLNDITVDALYVAWRKRFCPIGSIAREEA